MIRRAAIVAFMAIAMLVPAAAAMADPIVVGPCNDPQAVVVRVQDKLKVCVNPLP